MRDSLDQKVLIDMDEVLFCPTKKDQQTSGSFQKVLFARSLQELVATLSSGE